MHCLAVDGGVAAPRVIGTVGTDLADRLVRGDLAGIWSSSSGSMGASPTRLSVTSIALISSVSAFAGDLIPRIKS